ncbi:MAG: hypothetical protein GY723_15895 [bacterium]|nr:hypothetical protein [bacterium]MCP5071626.1 hypothetical protein [bacterium]
MSQCDRGSIAARLGQPTEQEGSAHEPRTREEQGVRWNEKWIYRDPEHQGFDRVVLWLRSDLQGIWRVNHDGSSLREP